MPAQRPDGMIPWRTPILAFAVWVPTAMAVAALWIRLVGAPIEDLPRTPLSVGLVLAVIWIGKVRHWLAGLGAGFLTATAVSAAFVVALPVTATATFARFAVGCIAASYVFAAVSRVR